MASSSLKVRQEIGMLTTAGTQLLFDNDQVYVPFWILEEHWSLQVKI